MALNYTRNSVSTSPRPSVRKQKGMTTTAVSSMNSDPLQFVTTTSTVAIDESSKRAIRKHASRYVYHGKPPQFPGGNTSSNKEAVEGAAGGQIHRFRLGPQGLKHTPNQPPQVSRNFEIISVKSDRTMTKPKEERAPLPGGIRSRGNNIHRPKRNVLQEDEDDELDVEPFSGTVSGQSGRSPIQQTSVELIRRGVEQHQLFVSQGSSIFGPSSGAMDPFNAMALPITPREQILLRYYCLYSTPQSIN